MQAPWLSRSRIEVLVQRVGCRDGALRPAGLVQHLARLAGEIGNVAGVQADAAFGNAQRAEHLVEGPDGVGHAGAQGVVGVDQQNGVGRVGLAVGAEGVQLAVEHLHPGMGHGAAGIDAENLIRHGAGCPGTAADIGRASAEDGAVGALRPAGAELQHGAALGRAADAVRLGGNQTLMIDGQQEIGLQQLRLNRGGTHGHQRLLGEDRGALGHGPDVAGEA